MRLGWCEAIEVPFTLMSGLERRAHSVAIVSHRTLTQAASGADLGRQARVGGGLRSMAQELCRSTLGVAHSMLRTSWNWMTLDLLRCFLGLRCCSCSRLLMLAGSAEVIPRRSSPRACGDVD
jgi:hypothetical protein